jgi:hypothetical protein
VNGPGSEHRHRARDAVRRPAQPGRHLPGPHVRQRQPPRFGVRHGDHGLPQEWLAEIEGRSTVSVLADGFATECVRR